MKHRSKVTREHRIALSHDSVISAAISEYWLRWASDHGLELVRAYTLYDWRTETLYEHLYLCGPLWRHKQMDLKRKFERRRHAEHVSD